MKRGNALMFRKSGDKKSKSNTNKVGTKSLYSKNNQNRSY